MFALKVVEMHNEYLDGGRSFALKALLFFNNWLSMHIPISDAEIGRFLLGGNIGPLQGVQQREVSVCQYQEG